MKPSLIRGYESPGVRRERPRLKLGAVETRARPHSAREQAVRPSERYTRARLPKAIAATAVTAAAPVSVVESRGRLWLVVLGLVTVVAFFGVWVYWPKSQSAHALPKSATLAVKPVAEEPLGTKVAGMRRLNSALSSVPGAAIPGILMEANVWLAGKGYPDCSVRAVNGQVSLVLGAGTLSPQPFEATLQRCASAVEHVLK